AATGDLSKLLANIERFFDLGIEHLAGQMKATGEIRRRDRDTVVLSSRVLLDGFTFVVSKNEGWSEQHLELTIDATGLVDQTPTLTKVSAGEFHLTSGRDRFDFVLQKPIDLTSPTRSYTASTSLKGSAGSWQNRLRPLAALPGWKLTGDVNLS